jgi:hypothetical protein
MTITPAPLAEARFAFFDLETVTLEPRHDVIWEAGVITRDGLLGKPTHWRFQLRPNMDVAVQKALDVGRFAERYIIPAGVEAIGWADHLPDDVGPAHLTHDAAATWLRKLLDGRIVVGAVASFDTVRTGLYLAAHGFPWPECEPWHYRPVCVETLAVGWLAGRASAGLGWSDFQAVLADAMPAPADQPLVLTQGQLTWPWKSEALSLACGVRPPSPADRHTAIGDARWAMRWFDALVAAGVPIPLELTA